MSPVQCTNLYSWVAKFFWVYCHYHFINFEMFCVRILRGGMRRAPAATPTRPATPAGACAACPATPWSGSWPSSTSRFTQPTSPSIFNIKTYENDLHTSYHERAQAQNYTKQKSPKLKTTQAQNDLGTNDQGTNWPKAQNELTFYIYRKQMYTNIYILVWSKQK